MSRNNNVEIGFAKASLSLASLIMGSSIYLLFRDKELLIFKWLDRLRLMPLIDMFRKQFSDIHTCYWVKYNLPACLWLLSYMLIIDIIWGENNRTLKKYFVFLMPVLSILSEFMQMVKILPGTFDILDVLSYCLAIFIFIAIVK